MSPSSALVGCLLLLGLFNSGIASTCESPKHTATYYSTTDAFFHYSTTFIVEFVLTCANARDVPVYAEVNGKVLQAAISEETSKYQISWQEEHEHATAGIYKVNIFDQDGYSAYRKAQRNNEDLAKVSPLFTVELKHAGVSKGTWIATETVATLVAIGVLYFAYNLKASLLA